MYWWKICELLWKGFGETMIDNRHKMYLGDVGRMSWDANLYQADSLSFP